MASLIMDTPHIKTASGRKAGIHCNGIIVFKLPSFAI